MGEKSWIPPRFAIFDVVVERVIVAAGELKCGKQRFGLRP